MKVLSWNLNHRAARRAIPDWVVSAIEAEAPDLAILTEYVAGPDHHRFLGGLSAAGLPFVSLSDQVKGENQILIASRESLSSGHLFAPAIHSAVPPNALHVTLNPSRVHCLGFRLPAFKRVDKAFARTTWEWLLKAASELIEYPSIIAGDFNTALEDSVADCGDCLRSLVSDGWSHVQPKGGYSFRHAQTGSERRIDHLFVSPAFVSSGAEYSWGFHKYGGDAASGKVGVPDHAMLLARLNLAPTG